MADIDVCIIGAGIVGLAIGRALANSGQSVILIEKNQNFGDETSSRNSGVIHGGMYYPKDTLKASFCVRGNHMIYDYCKSHGIEAKRLGKLIVATDESEIQRLEEIYKKGIANNVNLELWDNKRTQSLEPVNAAAAIYSPNTGIVDAYSLMLSFLGEIEDNGGNLVRVTKFEYAEIKNNAWEISVSDKNSTYQITADKLILSAGLWSKSVAQNIEGLDKFIPQMHFAKGNYFKYNGKVPLKHLIYPLPSSTALGIHFTPDLSGNARFGPDMEEVFDIDYKVNATRKDLFAASIKKYWRNLDESLLSPDFVGIRPKIGNSIDEFHDFSILFEENHGLKGLVCLFGIESPGLTSSMAIGEYMAGYLA